MRTFGTIQFKNGQWEITKAEPHVCIKLKAIFNHIPKTGIPPFRFSNTPLTCADLRWFLSRYPMEISDRDTQLMCEGEVTHLNQVARAEEILLPSYHPNSVQLNDGEVARDYQVRAAEFHSITKRFLLGDQLGTGKTISAILTLLNPACLPGVVVVQTHLTRQWKAEIEKFTKLRVHIIKGTSVYNLPAADVYILKYSCLTGWVNMFQECFFKAVVFDEVQELRRTESQKYKAAMALSQSVEFALGLSATPIYNYASEIFNVLDVIKPGCLGAREAFIQEWCYWRGTKSVVRDPKALGSFLRENMLFLRRTRADIGRELPEINTLVHTVGYDEEEVKNSEELARSLAMRFFHGSFIEKGLAARELDLLVRHRTGVSKAREVAGYVRILLENNEPVILAGWHRDVYDIWREELKEFNPVFYTGSESEAQKEAAKSTFVSGKTNLFIISLRSGVGLDGLQHRCSLLVIGELDYSPMVHNQLAGRIDRDGQLEPVTVVYLVSEYGSDPVMIDLLGLKASQSKSVIDPFAVGAETSVSDDTRIRLLAERFLNSKQGGDLAAA